MMTNLPILRTISNHCCHCSNELEPFKHVLLLCECPTSLCRDCAIQQIIQRDRTYFSSLICPICGADTPLDKGTVSNQDYVHQEEERLVRSLCTILSIPIVKNIKFRSKLSITNFLTVVEAVEEQSKSSEVTGMIFSIFDTNSSSVMTMFLSRLACNLQWMKREEFQLQELNYGALETIEFRRNKFVKDFLVWISNNAPLSMLEEVGDGSGYCNVCGDNDLSVDGVLFSCECKFTICSVCVKRTMMQSLKPLDEGGKCPLCKHTNAFISNEKEAKKEQQSLLSSASNFLNVQIMGTKKALPLDTIWSKYESCGIPPYAFQPLEKEDFLERNYSRKDITKDIFHISRLEAYRISSQSSSTSDSLSLDEESDPRYYGPLSLIHIRKDPFLMILASVIQLSLTTNIASSPMIRDDIGPVNTNTELKLNSMLDTEISNESISLRLLLRKKSTQCPFCGVNPFSNSVLLFHVRQFHPNLVVEVKDLIRFQWQQCCICSSLHPNESEEIPNGAVDDDFVCTRCMNQENIITDVRGVSLRTGNFTS